MATKMKRPEWMTAAENLAFLRAIQACPADDTPRLVYADWLSDQSHEEAQGRAEFIWAQFRVRDRERDAGLPESYYLDSSIWSSQTGSDDPDVAAAAWAYPRAWADDVLRLRPTRVSCIAFRRGFMFSLNARLSHAPDTGGFDFPHRMYDYGSLLELASTAWHHGRHPLEQAHSQHAFPAWWNLPAGGTAVDSYAVWVSESAPHATRDGRRRAVVPPEVFRVLQYDSRKVYDTAEMVCYRTEEDALDSLAEATVKVAIRVG